MSILRVLFFSLLVMSMLASNACTDEEHRHSAEEATEGQPDAELNAKALQILIETEVPMVIVDARNSESFEKAHIAGAINVPSESSEDEISRSISDKEVLIITYCGSVQCPLSRNLARTLKNLGYNNVIEYPQGMEGWVKNLGPVEGSIIDDYRNVEKQ
jgi:rhodanese-related sulfurtransferase